MEYCVLGKNIDKLYSAKKVLDNVDIHVPINSIYGLIGPSGSGKSTLLHMLGGLDYPTSGTVKIAGKEIFQLNETELTIFRRRRIGFVFQNYNLVPMLNVYENVTLPIELDGSKVDKEFIGGVLKMLHLDDKLDRFPNQLSGGQQQRAAIARAIASKPAIVLADEPTGNLDSNTSVEVMNLMKRVVREKNQTLVMVTHDNYLAGFADIILRIRDGKILEIEDRTGQDIPDEIAVRTEEG